jgi:hypothetical protein
MKIFSARGPIKRSTALNCLLINQFATPGLGSLMGRRFLAGLMELIIALAGFGFVVGWFVQLFMGMLHDFSEAPANSAPHSWLGEVGLILFATAWLLSWITSVSLLREARRNEANLPPVIVPPRIQ